MSWTMSMRNEGVKRADVRDLVRHELRGVDRANGVETAHSNETIDPRRTASNRSWIVVDGVWQTCTDSRQVTEELDRRLALAGGTRVDARTGQVKRVAIRKDAAVVRNIVLQLDPDYSGSSASLVDDPAHREEVFRYLYQAVDFVAEQYGENNLLAVTVHVDEQSPHIHLMVTPIDEQGRVRQESFVKGPAGMAKAHRDLALWMRQAGYDAALEPVGRAKEHLGVKEYKRVMCKDAELNDLTNRCEDLLERERAIRHRETETVRQEEALAAKETEIFRQEQLADERAAVIAAETEQLERDRQYIQIARQAAEEEKAAAEDARIKYKEGMRLAINAAKAADEYAQTLKGLRLPPGARPVIESAVEKRRQAAVELSDWRDKTRDEGFAL